MNRKTLDRLPLIKLDRILDWAPIQQYLTNRKICCLCVNVGCPSYPLLSMFNVILRTL